MIHLAGNQGNGSFKSYQKLKGNTCPRIPCKIPILTGGLPGRMIHLAGNQALFWNKTGSRAEAADGKQVAIYNQVAIYKPGLSAVAIYKPGLSAVAIYKPGLSAVAIYKPGLSAVAIYKPGLSAVAIYKPEVSGRGGVWLVCSNGRRGVYGAAWLTGRRVEAADGKQVAIYKPGLSAVAIYKPGEVTPRARAIFLLLNIPHGGHAILLVLLGTFSSTPANLRSIFFRDGHDKVLVSLKRYIPVDFNKISSNMLPKNNYYLSVEDFTTCWQAASDEITRLSLYFWMVEKSVFVYETSPVTLLKRGGIEKKLGYRPEKGFALLNADASLKGGRGGWGAVLRDCLLRVLDFDFGSLSTASIDIAEAQCILHGIILAVRYRDADGHPISKLVCISDSTNVVTNFKKNPDNWDPKFVLIFRKIKFFASFLEEFILEWSPRETNELADYLAGIGGTGGAVDQTVFDAIVELDRIGIYFRLRQLKFPL